MQPTKQRVLCVVDDEDDGANLIASLNESIYEIKVARTAAQGLSIARSEHIDLYLLGMRLPHGMGAEISMGIREFDRDTPILFLTDDAEHADWEGANRAGAQAYMMQPNGLDGLLDVVAKLMDQP